MDKKEMKKDMLEYDLYYKDILEYDLYYVADGIPYGDYQLTIINEGDQITIIIEDDKGRASWTMNKKEFLNIGTNQNLEKHINGILYYNYIEYEGE